MSMVWGSRGADDSLTAREAKKKYQRKEMELEDERQRLQRLEVDLRAKHEEAARLRRAVEKAELDRVNLERLQRTLERSLGEAEHGRTAQKARVSRLEHEVEQFREASFRGRGEV